MTIQDIFSASFSFRHLFLKIALLSLGLAQVFFIRPGEAGIASSLMRTVDVKNPGEFEAKVQSDIIFNNGGGLNLTAHGVTGLVPHLLDLNVFIGSGSIDFQFGGLVSYNVLPDVSGQVGLSFLTGYRFLRAKQGPDDGSVVNHNLFTFGLLTSKKFQASMGPITPYAGLQIEALLKEGQSLTPITLSIGSRWQPSPTIPWIFYSELGLSLRESNYSLSFGAGYPF